MEKHFENYEIISNLEISKNTYEIILEGKLSLIKPGQFVNIRVPGKYLGRPFSIADCNNNRMNIVYKKVGSGTEILSTMQKKEKLKVLTGLGNGFDLEEKTTSPLLIGGGTGAAPIYYLASKLQEKGISPHILLGFKSKEESFYLEKFQAFRNCWVSYETNYHYQYVTDYIKEWESSPFYDYFYACGPKIMLKEISELTKKDGEVSLESRMACGIGQCKCCSIETNDGMKTLCKDGPVLKKRLIRWK